MDRGVRSSRVRGLLLIRAGEQALDDGTQLQKFSISGRLAKISVDTQRVHGLPVARGIGRRDDQNARIPADFILAQLPQNLGPVSAGNIQIQQYQVRAGLGRGILGSIQKMDGFLSVLHDVNFCNDTG